jgi:acyl-CoA synthetase (AMP-forming)/AMP-acid ligase II/thioesterase domain-containing protein
VPAILAPRRLPFTYRDLGAQLQYVSDRMRRMGIGPGDRVASILPNGPEAASALLTFGSVCTFAPLNPGLSAEELEQLLVDLSPRALLLPYGSGRLRPVARAYGIGVLEACWSEGDPAGSFQLEGAATGSGRVDEPQREDIFVILATSGTTGRPKLVPLTHECQCLTAQWLVDSLRLTPHDRCLNFSAMFHVLGINGGLLGPIAGGGSVVCAPEFHAIDFFKWLDEFRPTFFSAVPAVHQTILEHSAKHPEILARQQIRFMRTGGAPLPAATIRRIEEAFRAPLLQVYGMTEAPPICNDLVPPYERKPGSVGIRRGNRVVTMDESGNILPDGLSGEIVVSGPAVTPGYLNNPAANADAFRNGWFRTGDIGYFDPDGFLFLTGRRSEFINRGGEKIAPIEVDEALLLHPAVKEAVAFAIPDSKLGEEIAAAVVLARPVSTSELQRHVEQHLAAHKIPRHIITVDELPKGPTGKLSRAHIAAVLNVPAHDHAKRDTYVPPRNAQEEKLAAIWASVLDVPQVGVHDDFFEAGGDSLLAVQCLACVSDEFDLPDLPFSVLLEAPTIAQLAELLANPKELSAARRVLAIQPRGDRVPLFVVAPGLEFRRLARYLGPDYPIFGLEILNLEQVPPPHTIEAMAADCIDTLQRFRPEGPYVLTGWCLAGVIALEMAQQLVKAGEQPSTAVLIDARIVPAIHRHGVKRWLIPAIHWMQNAFFHLRTAADGKRPAVQYIRERGQSVQQSVRKTMRGASGAPLAHDDLAIEAIRRYHSQPYSGPMVHLWAQERPRGVFRNVEFYWGNVTDKHEVLDVPGDHVTIFDEPNVETMARHFATIIKRVEARSGLINAPDEDRTAQLLRR